MGRNFFWFDILEDFVEVRYSIDQLQKQHILEYANENQNFKMLFQAFDFDIGEQERIFTRL